ncbi:MAG TPA: flagellar biosynthetic protein FliO, partial [Hyphomicrobiaceae bacterium]
PSRRHENVHASNQQIERSAGAPASSQMEILYWLLFVIFIAALLVVSGLLLRGYFTTGSPSSALKDALSGNFFGPRPPKRLEVVDQANVDGRRKLLLIRRDGIEHLIMTGGPVDVVIETGIEPPEAPSSQSPMAEPAEPMFQRPARSLQEAVGKA